MLISSRQASIGSCTATLCALALAGCGGGGGHAASATAYFTLAIYDVADPSQTTALTCDEVAGSQLMIAVTDRAGHQYADAAPVNCSPGSQDQFNAATPMVPAGYYTVDFYLYGNPSVYGSPSPAIGSSELTDFYLGPGVTDYTTTISAPEPVWTESFFFAWTFLTSCRPGETVRFAFAKPNSSGGIIRDFDCTVYSPGTSWASYPIPIDYTSAAWNLSFLDTSGQALDSISGGPVPVPDGADIDLGTQAFRVH